MNNCYWIFVLIVSGLLLADGVRDVPMWTRSRVVPRELEESRGVFNLSLCLFSNVSLLRYSCHEQQDVGDDSFNKLNMFGVSKLLCGKYAVPAGSQGRQSRSCKNVSIFLLSSQHSGLCVSSDIAELKRVFVKLLVRGVNNQHYPTCVEPKSQFRKKYTFSCVEDVNNMNEMILTVDGYDVPVNSAWTTVVKVNVIHDCVIGETSHHKHDGLRLETLIFGGGSIIVLVGGSIVLAVFVKWYRKHLRHAMSRRLYAFELLKDLPTVNLPDPTSIESNDSDVSQTQTVTTDSNPGVANSSTSLHQQDNSSEDSRVSPLPTARRYTIIPVAWMESQM